jgi:hypothetical protein
LAFFRSKAGLLLIGVDPSRDEVFVLKGQHSNVVNSGELAQLISSHTGEQQEFNG